QALLELCWDARSGEVEEAHIVGGRAKIRAERGGGLVARVESGQVEDGEVQIGHAMTLAVALPGASECCADLPPWVSGGANRSGHCGDPLPTRAACRRTSSAVAARSGGGTAAGSAWRRAGRRSRRRGGRPPAATARSARARAGHRTPGTDTARRSAAGTRTSCTARASSTTGSGEAAARRTRR